MFTGADFQQVFGVRDDAMPHYEYQLGEWSIVPESGLDLVTGYYVSTECDRMSLAMDNRQTTSGGIMAQFDTYRTADQAKIGKWTDCTYWDNSVGGGPPVPVTNVKIGDGGACFADLGTDELQPAAGDDWDLDFQVGRTIVDLHNYQPVPKSGLPAMAAAMAPAAQQIAQALAGQ
ncbi:MAG TPA: hypothetical protein VHX38_20535 [Pseudonocardiaceae bacterium]|nr:hypothetical protein [Pseudonocardiaceae bacterium]